MFVFLSLICSCFFFSESFVSVFLLFLVFRDFFSFRDLILNQESITLLKGYEEKNLEWQIIILFLEFFHVLVINLDLIISLSSPLWLSFLFSYLLFHSRNWFSYLLGHPAITLLFFFHLPLRESFYSSSNILISWLS